MKQRIRLFLAGGLLIVTACVPIATGGGQAGPSATPLVLATASLPAATAVPVIQTEAATATPVVIIPAESPAPAGVPPIPVTPGPRSGPYAVFGVPPNDALNVRAGPWIGFDRIGALAYDAAGVWRSGPSALSDGDLWVQIERSGGAGWVNDYYLTESVAPADFCADARVAALLAEFKRAILARDGAALGGLVSPKHGLGIALYRLNEPIVFHAEDARWVFDSTYQHDWGIHPARGDAETGSFQEKVLPRLAEVFNAPYEQLCEQRDAIYQPAWPDAWTNLRVVKLYKPATDPNVTLDFRIWLAGIEYVNGQPYLAGLVHIEWEP